MIDLKNRIIFIHIPKTGGTAVERWFMGQRGLDWDDRGALGIFANPRTSRLARANQHCTLAQIEQLVFGGRIPDDFRLFTVVRHPERRFYSEWAWRRLPPERLSPVRMRMPAAVLMRLAERPWSRLPDLALHLLPQGEFLAGAVSAGRVRVLRHESLAEDFAALQADWGLPRSPLARENVSPRRRPVSPRQAETVRRFVERFYAEDFRRFGYAGTSVPAGAPVAGNGAVLSAAGS